MSVTKPERTGTDRAEMWQLVGGAVHIKGGIIFEMPGTARGVGKDSNGHWRLGGRIATLALIGTTEQLALYIQQHGEDIIRNDSNPEFDMPNIAALVTASLYGAGTGQPIRTLNPVGDATVAIVKSLTSFIPTTGFAELIMGFADLNDAREAMAVKPKAKTKPTDLRQITFCVAPASQGMLARRIDSTRDIRGCQLREFVDGIVDGLERVR